MPHRLTIVILLLFCLSGCSGPPSGVLVSGNVTFQDAPIESGALMFYPTKGAATSATITGGEYSVHLEPGEYSVTAALSVKLPEGWKEGDKQPKPDVVLPAKYISRLRTPLKTTITPDQSTPIDFALD